MGKRIPVPPRQRFWPKVDKSAGPDGCWLWTRAKNSLGYGTFFVSRADGKTLTALAHRFAWQETNGEIPAGALLCHTCDTPSCVNPAHLFLGTDADNWHDMIAKGRAHWHKRTHCKRGHEFTPENTKIRDGYRDCRACSRIHWTRSNEKRKQQRQSAA